jgi:O-antigen ligase
MATLLVPWLLTYSQAPASTFFNQAAAWAAWGVMLLVLSLTAPPRRADLPWRTAAPVLAALGLIAAASAWSVGGGSLPASLGLGTALTVLGTAGVAGAGVLLAAEGRLALTLTCIAVPITVAAMLSAGIAALQVYLPGWEGTWWAATEAQAGRASGNLRQPNHLSSLAVWALIGLVWLAESRRLGRAAAIALMLLMVAVVMATGSRTGQLGLVILAVWGAVDRRLSGSMRWTLVSLPIAFGVFWQANQLWTSAQQAAGVAIGAARAMAEGDLSSARFSIWSDTLALIARQPWTGVGVGEFNFAWSLTPFPGRSGLFFDHAHNLVLHLLAELGLPLGGLVIGLLCLGLWRAFRAAGQARSPADALALRTAFMLLLLIAVHSLLEYPLWYAYFLLPTAMALGLCLAGPLPSGSAPDSASSEAETTGQPARALAAGAVLLLAGSVWAVIDYQRVVVIFTPAAAASAPLADRIEAGKRSLFFAHHAHYAAATTAARPADVADDFLVASHFLLDTRLMMAWARAYAQAGDLARARHLADRLREFRNEASAEFFDACRAPAAPEPPFQCQPASEPIDHRAFR